MTIMDRFTDNAGRAFVEAGLGAIHRGRDRLDTDVLLLGLFQARAANATLRRQTDLTSVRREVDRRAPTVDDEEPAYRRRDRESLATLGINLDEVTTRMYRAAGVNRDDPRLWTLRRSPVRRLRLTLSGPAGSVQLTGRSRKVVEVASWAAGHGRPITGDHLLWGLLADGTNRSVHILHRLGVDLHPIWTDVKSRGRRR
jgi:hypothetical protein